MVKTVIYVSYASKILDHAKQSVTDALKTTSVQVKCIIQKTAEPTGDIYKDIYLENKGRKSLIT